MNRGGGRFGGGQRANFQQGGGERRQVKVRCFISTDDEMVLDSAPRCYLIFRVSMPLPSSHSR